MGHRLVVLVAMAGVLLLCAATSALASSGSGGAAYPEPTKKSTKKHKKVKLPKVLRDIAQCESGSNPRAVSPSGRYRGKFQFDYDTWHSVGGTGDPAKTPEWRQDKLALKLYHRRGTDPWPNCAPKSSSAR
jgi:soluble lytic murein transglycosylase-like protein